MFIGYIRPNEDDLNCRSQLAALDQHGYERLYKEEHSSAKKRIALEKLLDDIQPGETVVVAKLFSLADSTRHLAEILEALDQKKAYLVSIDEGIHTNPASGWNDSFQHIVNILLDFQSDIISENTKKGLNEAKQKGKRAGRPRKPDENVKQAISMYQSKQYTLAEIRKETGISKTTLYRYLES